LCKFHRIITFHREEFKTRVLRKTFGPKRYEVTGQCKRLHNEKLYVLYSSPNILQVIKSSKTWVWHGTHTGNRRLHTGLWCGYLMETDHFADPGIDGRIILKFIFKWNGEAREDCSGPR
jgi:hypothetical protein